MNKRITEIIENHQLSLSDEDSRTITAAVGIEDLRRNPTEEQELRLSQICHLIKDGKTVIEAISSVVEPTDNDSEDSGVLSDADIEAIIISQANKAADATLSSLPNIAESEGWRLRQTFIQQFRRRIEEQLKSPEYQQAFIEKIESLGEYRLSSNIPSTALPGSSSSSN